MSKLACYSNLRKQVDSKGKGATLKAKLRSLKGTSLMKEYMACLRSGKKKPKTAKRSKKSVKSSTRKSRK